MQELSFIHAISSIVARSQDAQRTLEHIADLAIEIPGISAVQFTGLDVSAGDPSTPHIAVATADISTDGRQWGEVRIRFDVRSAAVESPVKLARFIGQQAGLVLARAEDEARKEALLREADVVRRDLETRKVVQRAGGILAHTHGITQPDAAAMLKAHSQRTGQSIRHIAEAIVTASSFGSAKPSPVRRSA